MRPRLSDWGILTRAALVWFVLISAVALVLVLIRGLFWIAYLPAPSGTVLLFLLWLEHRRAGVRFIGGPRVPETGSFSNNPVVRLLAALVGAGIVGLILFLTR